MKNARIPCLLVLLVAGLGSCSSSTEETPATPKKDTGPESAVDSSLPDGGEDAGLDTSVGETPDDVPEIDTSDGGGCSAPLKKCGDKCVDTGSDPANCGACGFGCKTTELCSGGACVPCADPKIRCGAACVDTMSDPGNCGTCGKACVGDEKCAGGTCTVICGAGTTMCGSKCVSLVTDPKNCGACGKACALDEDCISASCEKVCTAPAIKCYGKCVDTTTDIDNCGACGKSCGSGGKCTASTCSCVTGATMCGGLCVDLTKDPSNCGACGTYCGPGGTCVGSVCTSCGSFTNCSGKCVDTNNDPLNCGTCAKLCTGSTPDCVAGVCIKKAVTYSGSFTGGAPTSSTTATKECTDFETFRKAIDSTKSYTKVTIRRPLDGASSACTGSGANTLCQAMRTQTASSTSTSVSCDGKTWMVGNCGSMVSGTINGVELTDTGMICGCGSGTTIRPCIGNNNWGGVTGTTCSSATQTIDVLCE